MLLLARQTAFLALAVLISGPTSRADGIQGVVTQDFIYSVEPQPMRLPTAVAIGPNDGVYVLDGVHDRVIAFHADGTLASVITPRHAGAGPAESALRQPVGLRVASDGRLWIADSGNGRIVVCGPDGVVSEVLALPAGDAPADPTDVALSADGSTVWVTDNDGQRVLRYDVDAATWRSLGTMGEGLGQWQYPYQLCLNRRGELFVSDVINARVQVLAADGNAVRTMGTHGVELGQFVRPGGLAIDRDGAIWVADSVLGVVQVLRDDGAVVDALRDAAGRPHRFESPLGLAFDDHGALYVVESRANRVRKLVVSRTSGPPPVLSPRRPGDAVPPARACTICHVDWLPPFAQGRDSSLAARPAAGDEPVASRSEICLSCHDGTVADSRHRVWAEHGHQTGVVPPRDMSVPAHLPLASGTIACRTCHSAHDGNVPQDDFRRAIALRMPNQASELCATCHADKTRGSRFGTHPTGGLPWAIPTALVEAGAKPGPNTRELTCQVCHTPHGAKAEHLLVMSAASNQLCLTCHDSMRPGMFRDGDHTEHPLMARVNSAQAAAIADVGGRIGPDGRLVCLSCHKLHHGKGGRFLLADDLSDGDMCLRCHEGRRELLGTPHDLRTNFPHERNRLGMTIADAGACSACHLFHRYARETAPGVGDAAGHCLSCHREGACAQNKQLGNINHPSSRCTDCHDPHQPRYGSFLRESTDDLCSRCHLDKTLLFGGPHDSIAQTAAWCDASEKAGDRCLACHRPHGDPRHGLFRVAPVASQVAADASCMACHADTVDGGVQALLHPRFAADRAIHSGLPLSDGSNAGVQIGCLTCHDPHGGPTPDGAMLHATARGGIELCVRCHTEMTQIVVTAHSPEALQAHGLESAACLPCHQVHGDSRTIADRLLWPNALLDPAGGRDQHCLGCHRDGGAAHPPAIASHPDVPMFTIAATGAGALPLFDSSGQPDARGAIGCGTCHLPHGRSMPDVPITAQRTPELRAQRLQLRPFEPPNTCTNCHSADALRRFLYFHNPERRVGTPAWRQPSADESRGSPNSGRAARVLQPPWSAGGTPRARRR